MANLNFMQELLEKLKNLQKPVGKIICGFPGVGKSTLFNELKNKNFKILDSDSSTFDKKDFPKNYIEHIKERTSQGYTILASSHDTVRDALIENNMEFVLVYPDKSLKEEYLQRYTDRGSPQSFNDLIKSNWNKWIDQCDSLNNELVTKVVLQKGQFLSYKILANNLINDILDGASQKELVTIIEKISSLIPIYKKVGKYSAKLARNGEKVDTNIDGELETTNIAQNGDVIVRGPKDEEYILTKQKFEEKYITDKKLTNNYQKFEAKGLIRAFKYSGKTAKFKASWGEYMSIKNGDMLAFTVESETDDKVIEVYRIEKEIFEKTYNKI